MKTKLVPSQSSQGTRSEWVGGMLRSVERFALAIGILLAVGIVFDSFREASLSAWARHYRASLAMIMAAILAWLFLQAWKRSPPPS